MVASSARSKYPLVLSINSIHTVTPHPTTLTKCSSHIQRPSHTTNVSYRPDGLDSITLTDPVHAKFSYLLGTITAVRAQTSLEL